MLDYVNRPVLVVKHAGLFVFAVLWTRDIDSLLASIARMVPLSFGADFVAGDERMLHLDVLF